MSNYYKNQLEKIKLDKEYTPNIVLSDSVKNKTNHLDLNLESIPVLIEYLKGLEKQLNERRTVDNVTIDDLVLCLKNEREFYDEYLIKGILSANALYELNGKEDDSFAGYLMVAIPKYLKTNHKSSYFLYVNEQVTNQAALELAEIYWPEIKLGNYKGVKE